MVRTAHSLHGSTAEAVRGCVETDQLPHLAPEAAPGARWLLFIGPSQDTTTGETADRAYRLQPHRLPCLPLHGLTLSPVAAKDREKHR